MPSFHLPTNPSRIVITNGRQHLRFALLLTGIVAALLIAFMQPVSYVAHAAGVSWPDQTRVGIHNTYEKSTFTYFIDALESGAGLVELDVWQDYLLSGKYRVSHDAVGNNNNCEDATSYDQLRHLDRNQGFADCLNEIRLWHFHNPNHAALLLKLELKNGFETSSGFGPNQFDAYLAKYLGSDIIFKPADLMGSTYGDLDSAARANAWPTVDQLTGKIIVVIVRGTVEKATKSYFSDQEYIDHLTSLKSAGQLSQAMAFPAYLGAAAGDPRPSDRRAWYIFFDGDASTYVSLDTSFYYTDHYVLTMTDAQSVSPAISDTAPSVSDAQNRVNLLAAHAATIVSSDWSSAAIDDYTTTRIYSS